MIVLPKITKKQFNYKNTICGEPLCVNLNSSLVSNIRGSLLEVEVILNGIHLTAYFSKSFIKNTAVKILALPEDKFSYNHFFTGCVIDYVEQELQKKLEVLVLSYGYAKLKPANYLNFSIKFGEMKIACFVDSAHSHLFGESEKILNADFNPKISFPVHINSTKLTAHELLNLKEHDVILLDGEDNNLEISFGANLSAVCIQEDYNQLQVLCLS